MNLVKKYEKLVDELENFALKLVYDHQTDVLRVEVTYEHTIWSLL